MSNERSKPLHSVLSTDQTDSESVAVEKAKAGASGEHPESLKTATETRLPSELAKEHPLSSAVAASESQAPVEAGRAMQAQAEARAESQAGEKRDLDSTAAPVSAPVSEDKDKPAPEKSDEPDAKKQKTEQEPTKKSAEPPTKDTNGPAPTAAGAATGETKKAGRSKKEKVKDVMKKAVPTEGIGSRTRSRTKAT